jgi:hypothetical protein
MLSEVFAAASPEALETVVHDVAAAFGIDPSALLRFERRCYLHALSPGTAA